jgi:raffinose/stachyose/melibiose transport system substrate-binding protein
MNKPETGRMFSRRRFLAGSAVALGSVAAASAASASPLVKTSQLVRPSQSSTPLTVNGAAYVTSSALSLFNQMTAEYNKVHKPGLTINLNSVSPGTGAPLYEAKIRSLISAGNQPDLFLNYIHSLAYPYIKQGLIAPTTAWFAKYGWDKLLYQDAVAYVKYRGVPYGVPVSLLGMPFWYRPSIFKKAGVSVPKTFAQFESAMDSISKMGVAPIAVGEIYGWDLMRIFEYLLEVSVGPTVHDRLINYETSWNTPGVADTFGLLKKWGDKKWLLPGFGGTNPNQADALYVAGRAAMDLTGPWEEGSLQGAGAPEGDFAVFIGPTDHTPLRFSGFTEQWQISSKLSAQKMSALGEFMNWTLQPEQQRKYYAILGATATVDGVPAQFPIGKKILGLQSTHETFTVMDEAMGQEFVNVFYTILDGVTKGNMTPTAAAAAMQSAAKKYGSSTV